MKYIALFRGINVGGKNIVKMADLKTLFVGLGYSHVQTYIQSGNAIFDADEEIETIQAHIQNAFSEMFGFESAVLLRTKDDITTVLGNPPFSPADIAQAEAANPDVEHLYVYFLEETSTQESFQRIYAEYQGADRLSIWRKALFLLCHQSIRNSKLAATLSQLNIPMTSRNWKTLCKLHDMLNQTTFV